MGSTLKAAWFSTHPQSIEYFPKCEVRRKSGRETPPPPQAFHGTILIPYRAASFFTEQTECSILETNLIAQKPSHFPKARDVQISLCPVFHSRWILLNRSLFLCYCNKLAGHLCPSTMCFVPLFPMSIAFVCTGKCCAQREFVSMICIQQLSDSVGAYWHALVSTITRLHCIVTATYKYDSGEFLKCSLPGLSVICVFLPLFWLAHVYW